MVEGFFILIFFLELNKIYLYFFIRVSSYLCFERDLGGEGFRRIFRLEGKIW